MRRHRATQMRRMVAAGLLTAGLLSGCSGTKTGSETAATASSPDATSGGGGSVTITTTTVAPPTPAATATSSGAKCSDLTNAEASAVVGKPTTVTLDTSGTPLAGLTLCDVTVQAGIYPIQLAVDTKEAKATYAADKQAYAGTELSGLGDKAFTSSVGVEALSGGVTISVTGPAGPVLSGDFTLPTAIVRAMIEAMK